MYNSSRRTNSLTAFALSTVVTLGMLGTVHGLASKPVVDAMLVEQGQTQVAAFAKLQPAKT